MNTIKKYPLYRKLILNNLISTIGDSMYYIALMTYAAQFPNPGLAISLVTLSEALPGIFFIITGSLADLSLSKTQKVMTSGIIRSVLYLIVGVIIGFKASLLILVGIVVINFISDIVGKYSSGLMTPFVLYLVKQEDLEEAQGLNGAIAQLIGLASSFIGAFLMGIFSFRVLAWINSATFFASFIIIYSISTTLISIEREKINPSQQKQKFSFKQLWQQIVTSLQAIRGNAVVLQAVLMFAFANTCLTVLSPLLSLFLAQNPSLVFNSFAFTLALLQGTMGAMMIIGTLYGPRVFRKQSLVFLCQIIFVGIILIGLAFYSKQMWLLVIGFAVVGLFTGSSSPKLNALIITSFPLDKLATISGGVNTVLLLTPPIATVVFTTIGALNFNYAALLLTGFSVASIIANLVSHYRKKTTRVQEIN